MRRRAQNDTHSTMYSQFHCTSHVIRSFGWTTLSDAAAVVQIDLHQHIFVPCIIGRGAAHDLGAFAARPTYCRSKCVLLPMACRARVCVHVCVRVCARVRIKQ